MRRTPVPESLSPAQTLEWWSVQRFGSDVDVFDRDITLRDWFAEVMILNVDMICAWSQFGCFCQFYGAHVIFECFAFDDWCHVAEGLNSFRDVLAMST